MMECAALSSYLFRRPGKAFPVCRLEFEVVIMIAVVIEEMEGRTEFLTPTIRSEPRLESAKHYESEMALFNECMQSCAHIVLDIADIVRDGE